MLSIYFPLLLYLCFNVSTWVILFLTKRLGMGTYPSASAIDLLLLLHIASTNAHALHGAHAITITNANIAEAGRGTETLAEHWGGAHLLRWLDWVCGHAWLVSIVVYGRAGVAVVPEAGLHGWVTEGVNLRSGAGKELLLVL